MAANFTALEAAINAQGALIASVQAEIASLQSSAVQSTIDTLTAQVDANNTALSGLTAPSS